MCLMPLDIESIQGQLPDKHKLKSLTLPELCKNHPLRESFKKLEADLIASKDIKSKNNLWINFSNLNFTKECIFFNLIFPIDVYFNNTKFSENTYFTNAVFINVANFENAEFHGETANFRDAAFKKEADFNKTTFKEYANFKGATFSDRTIFQLAKFELHAPRFYGAKFNNELILNRIGLPETKKFIHNENYKVYQETIKENKNKDKSTCQLYQATIAKRKNTHETYQKIIEENKSAYETLLHLMEKQNKHHDKHRFFREEMRWRQLGNKLTRERRITDSGGKAGKCYFIRWLIENCCAKKRIERDLIRKADGYYSYWQQLENDLNIVIFGLYGMLSDYGYGMGRALAWWFVHICVWATVLFFTVFKDKCTIYERFFCSVITSLSNAHSFFLSKGERLSSCYNKDDITLEFNLVWAFETIFGAMLLFILLLTLRVRFRIGGTTSNNKE